MSVPPHHHSPQGCLSTWIRALSWMSWAPSWTVFPSSRTAFTCFFSFIYNRLGWNKGLQGWVADLGRTA